MLMLTVVPFAPLGQRSLTTARSEAEGESDVEWVPEGGVFDAIGVSADSGRDVDADGVQDAPV